MGNSQELAERKALWPSSARPLPRVAAAACRKIPIIRNHPPPLGRASAGLTPSRHPASMEIPDMSDFQITDQGSIFLIRPRNEAARQWLDENVISEPWQWVQCALCVEARFARDLIIEIEQAGFLVTR
jgi:hypothetical protein